MQFDVEAIIRDVDDLTVEDREILRGLYGKSQKLQGGYLRQADYDRGLNKAKEEASRANEEVARARSEVESEVRALAEWKTGQDGNLQALQTRAAKAEQDALTARQALERAATDAGTDVSRYLEGASVVTPKVETPAFDASRFVDRDALSKVVLGNLDVQAEMLDLAAEHQQLFGEPLRNARELVAGVMDEAKRGNTNATIRDAWRKKFDVDAKLKANDEASIQRRISDAVTAAEVRIKSEAALGSGQFSQNHGALSPVLQMAAAKAGTRHGGIRPGVEAAIGAHNQAEAAKRK